MKNCLILALLLTGCEEIESKWQPTDWLTLVKVSEFEKPDRPEQVCITIRTSDGKMWDAEWVKR